MIKVSHEMPLALLRDGFEEHINDYFYALVHLYEKNAEYYNYTVDALKAGREVILDNSAFELHGKPFDTKGFVYWINRLAKDAGEDNTRKNLTYIIPDVFNDKEKTMALTKEFLKDYSDLPGKAMSVCQGTNFEEMTEIFKFYLDQPSIAKIGVSFMSESYTNSDKIPSYKDVWEERKVGRRYFITELYKKGLLGKKPIHLLGAAVADEFIYYTTQNSELEPFIESLDTSAPIIQGMFSNELYDFFKRVPAKRPEKLADYLDIEISSEVEACISYNAGMFKIINHL